ncbi:pirin family protein [Pseudoalteromonas piscicida]|uniref:Pirin family protein n=1 Tax=Pseudoalteromonas piscicida TaxID=43662 RepID=A0AAQ2ESP1_PSEO7|nr:MULTISPECIES: pirin family protein [Pseudoalteromonas]KJY86312.1 pirin [Pseudoalteromonas piscicida]TMN34636.1 pirin family protein [Pseudoalteromonas piscicida]TMN35134.1 pirin family protein [Pseudoalteromonas piscicida]TMN46633.1 pirin family protein [Pseudoalteromonas piscicida]TMN58311.1 pirin family protein [Pseudoalteromonas piscicida]
MKIIRTNKAQATQDGAGVNINRIAGFDGKSLDPYLMIDELKSDNRSDFMAGFPPHPHRGIETFTYIRKGGFEHRDQMGNVKAIRSGDVQWMSTGRGVVHSEMPLSDAEGMHGFQIWLNMPAKDKMRAPRYQDTTEYPAPQKAIAKAGHFKALAGTWQVAGEVLTSSLQSLAGEGALADVTLTAGSQLHLELAQFGKVMIYIHSGRFENYGEQTLLELDASQNLALLATDDVGFLILAGQPINEKIAHMGPFVMNTQEELHQAVKDYQQGRFGDIV